jgi:predicted Zn-dependent protease
MEDCSRSECEMVRRLLANQRFDDARDLVLQLTAMRGESDALELLLSEIYVAESNLGDATACVMALWGKRQGDPVVLQALVKLYRSTGDIAKTLEVRCLPGSRVAALPAIVLYHKHARA